jgi:hypothetical protein
VTESSPDLEVAVVRYAQLKAAIILMRTTDPDYPAMAATFRRIHDHLGRLLSRRAAHYDAPDGLRYVWSKTDDSLVVCPIPSNPATPKRHPKGWISPSAGKKRPRILHY